jgi:hypothetical protein
MYARRQEVHKNLNGLRPPLAGEREHGATDAKAFEHTLQSPLRSVVGGDGRPVRPLTWPWRFGNETSSQPVRFRCRLPCPQVGPSTAASLRRSWASAANSDFIEPAFRTRRSGETPARSSVHPQLSDLVPFRIPAAWTILDSSRIQPTDESLRSTTE